MFVHTLHCHAGACPGHPRLSAAQLEKTWMAGTRPAMTAETRCMSASERMSYE